MEKIDTIETSIRQTWLNEAVKRLLQYRNDEPIQWANGDAEPDEFREIDRKTIVEAYLNFINSEEIQSLVKLILSKPTIANKYDNAASKLAKIMKSMQP